MITFDEALAILLSSARPLPTERVSLFEANLRVLAEDIVSDMDMPPFDKSAMDGYACRRADLAQSTLRIIEEIPAGIWPTQDILPGTCARILTGAPVPTGADCVIMQEQTTRDGDTVRILEPGTAGNICRKAEDIRSGDCILRAGERITPAHIAALAAVGIAHPKVSRRPRVAVLATGDELVEPSVAPKPGQIRNSNGWQVCAQVNAMGAVADYRGIVGDRKDTLRTALEGAMAEADVLMISGGVSTGDFDLVPGMLDTLGFTIHFDSIAMQPGRPTLFGRKGNLYCCGLPGNPVATYVGFELLFKPFLLRLMGHAYHPLIIEAKLGMSLRRRKANRQTFIPVRLTAPDRALPIDYHGSAHINAMTYSDGVIDFPLGTTEIHEGSTVRVRSFRT